MCGNSSQRSQGGALAVLSLSHDISGSPIRSRVPVMAGCLTFRDQDEGNSISASYVTFTVDLTTCMPPPEETCMIGIHETGDLRTSAIMSPFKFKLNLTKLSAVDEDSGTFKMSAKLDHLLMASVGGDGIIGRRVSLWTPQSIAPFAEGIIGFN
ncbi:hypothetical protein BKA67DRAFT_260819 [Truncatella angustata]|uniref:Uncharacterized protein n=1 Tax=Truncatella angustata TaxID=152316 RepID=A0A9P8ZXA8_9PEZI|nr:uncharacterized protein BKA67DRAFT_260819 [Truncatella angustata]KAH6653794.1 hypothetical protein BKA67DRAFT_260819 [Truncatella angustata]